MDGGSNAAPDSANNALDTLGDLVFSHDILANDMSLTGDGTKAPAWSTATPNTKFGAEEPLFFDSPSVAGGAGGLSLPNPSPAQHQHHGHQDSERQSGPMGGGREHLQQQEISDEAKKVSPDLQGDSMAMHQSHQQQQQHHHHHHHHYANGEQMHGSADVHRDNQQMHGMPVSMNGGPQDPHQQYSQHHQMRQPQSDGMLPVPSAWKYHEATGPGGLPGMGNASGGGMHPPPPGSDMGGGSGQHYQQHGPGSAGAPGYHGPWTAPSQQSGSMGGGPQNMNSQQQQPVQQQGQHQAQQWPQQQFWQMVSQNQGQLNPHPAGVDNMGGAPNTWNAPTRGGGGGGKAAPKELSDKRRQERNNREQKRSKRISDQIKELKTLLEVSGVQTAKGNKSSVLTCAAEYIEDLQRRNQMLARGDGVNGHGMDGGGGLKKVSEGEGEGGDKDNMDDVDGANPNRVDYQRVFYDQSVPMAITSVDGRFVDCNWRFERESGYKKEDLVRMTFFTIARSDGNTSIFHAVAEMLKESREEVANQSVVRALLKPPAGQQPDKMQKYLTLSTVHDRDAGPRSEVRYFSCAILAPPVEP